MVGGIRVRCCNVEEAGGEARTQSIPGLVTYTGQWVSIRFTPSSTDGITESGVGVTGTGEG